MIRRGERGVGLYGRPPWFAWRRGFLEDRPPCPPRATIKAHPSPLHRPRPYEGRGWQDDWWFGLPMRSAPGCRGLGR